MIRNAEHADIGALAALWARAFPGERTVEQRIRHLETGGVYGGIESAFLAEQGGRVVGAYRAYPLSQYMHDSTFRMMGLAAVAVDDTARRRGIGRALCEHAISVARERGDALSVLYPFRPAFYHDLGWGMVGELHAHRFRPEALRLTASGASVVRANGEDASAIAACYERAATGLNGLIARTPRIWRSHLEGTATHVYVTGSREVTGYMIVRFGQSASPDDKPLLVREIVARDHESYESLLAWIADQRDAWRIIHYDASPDERFAHRLSDPRAPRFQPARYLWAPVARVICGPMLRIIDVRRAIEGRVRWGPTAPLRFGLHVGDDIVAGNQGPFIVDFDGRAASVSRGSAAPLLRVSIAGLSQIFAGELTVEEALNLGFAECDGDASAVNALFRVDRCFRLLDEF